MDQAAWDEALGAYYAEHDRIGTDSEARGPQLLAAPLPADLRRAQPKPTASTGSGRRDRRCTTPKGITTG